MNGGNIKKRALNGGGFHAPCGDSDLEILAHMLDGLGVGQPHETAIRLLERFGNLGGVFAATEAELEMMGLTAREGAFFAFVNPARRRGAVDGDRSNVSDESAALNAALSLLGRNKAGLYAVYLDGVGHRIYAEYLGEQCQLSSAAVSACRHKTKKLLIVGIKRDGDVSEITMSRAAELSDLTRLLDILEIEFVDYMETDGAEFFSIRRAITKGTGKESVFDGDATPYGKIDFRGGIEEYTDRSRRTK